MDKSEANEQYQHNEQYEHYGTVKFQDAEISRYANILSIRLKLQFQPKNICVCRKCFSESFQKTFSVGLSF